MLKFVNNVVLLYWSLVTHSLFILCAVYKNIHCNLIAILEYFCKICTPAIRKIQPALC